MRNSSVRSWISRVRRPSRVRSPSKSPMPSLTRALDRRDVAGGLGELAREQVKIGIAVELELVESIGAVLRGRLAEGAGERAHFVVGFQPLRHLADARGAELQLVDLLEQGRVVLFERRSVQDESLTAQNQIVQAAHRCTQSTCPELRRSSRPRRRSRPPALAPTRIRAGRSAPSRPSTARATRVSNSPNRRPILLRSAAGSPVPLMASSSASDDDAERADGGEASALTCPHAPIEEVLHAMREPSTPRWPTTPAAPFSV